MSDVEAVWCVKEHRGPWHATVSGFPCSLLERIVSTLCGSSVYQDPPNRTNKQRQPDCEKCLSILRYRAKRMASEEEDKKQGVLF